MKSKYVVWNLINKLFHREKLHEKRFSCKNFVTQFLISRYWLQFIFLLVFVVCVKSMPVCVCDLFVIYFSLRNFHIFVGASPEWL